MAFVPVMHYMNQFFSGIGSEDKADTPLGYVTEAVGPGKRLQQLLGDSAKIVVTAYCGDNYFAAHRNEVLASIQQLAREKGVKIALCGPAFQAGRYGYACMEVCRALSEDSGIDCVSGMHSENPGMDLYKQYKNRKIYAVPTSPGVHGMEEALQAMSRLAGKLAANTPIGPANSDGYVPRGFRIDGRVGKTGVERAIDMLLAKRTGADFATEIPLANFEAIPVPKPINLKNACIALAYTGGLVPKGKPYSLIAVQNVKWSKYDIGKLKSMTEAEWEAIHGGYVVAPMVRNPNYGVPLDACRYLVDKGVFASVYPYFYSTSGNLAWINAMQVVGREMAQDMKAGGVDGVILVST